MVTGAARLTPGLLDALSRVDDGKIPIAEVWRRIGHLADVHGLTRPSYERVRVLVRDARAERRPLGPSDLRLIWEGGMGLRSYGNTMDELWRPREERRPRR